MSELIPVLSSEEIDKIVTDLAERISADYQGRELVVVGVLKGAFIFLSDLVRRLTIPAKIDFVRVASYGSRTDSSGSIRLTKSIEIDIADKDVLLVEDIVDTGITLKWLLDHLATLEPRTVRVCALIDKRERRQAEIDLEYSGPLVKEGFLVGYGLDHAENYRYLPAIYHLKI